MQNSTRERLIPIVLDSLMKHIDKSCNLAENIVDDLIANGVILPPCDVGDTVYEFVPSWSKNPKISASRVQRIEMTSSRELRITLKKGFSDGSNKYYLLDQNQIGKTMFFDKKQAEATLKEMKNRNEA